VKKDIVEVRPKDIIDFCDEVMGFFARDNFQEKHGALVAILACHVLSESIGKKIGLSSDGWVSLIEASGPLRQLVIGKYTDLVEVPKEKATLVEKIYALDKDGSAMEVFSNLRDTDNTSTLIRRFPAKGLDS